MDRPYGRPDALAAPCYTGAKRLARCPLTDYPEGGDVAVLGILFGESLVRAGSRTLCLGGDYLTVLGEQAQ